MVVTLFARSHSRDACCPVPRSFNLLRGSWKVLTWGGLLGDVVLSILVQGSSIGRVTRKAIAQT